MTPTTHASEDVLAWLHAERRIWADREAEAGDDTYTAVRARARRQQLEQVIERMPADLARVERAAVANDHAESERMDRELEMVP